MGLLDRAIAFAEEKLAPEWGLRRATARAKAAFLASGYSYHGASRNKKSMDGWRTMLGGPDSDIVDNLDTLRERARDLYMGDGLAGGALKTIRSNEVGPGLQLNASIAARILGLSDNQAQEWEDRVEREFRLWAGTKLCDASRRCTFGELQALARLSQLMSGDVFALLPMVERKGERFDLHVLLLEADRVCNPTIVPSESKGADILGGVEVGELGEPLAYWIADKHPADTFVGNSNVRIVRQPKWTRVPAFGSLTGRPMVLHLMESERPGQRRGVPLLAPVIEDLKQLSRYKYAELMAAVVAGFFTVAITSEHPQQPIQQVLPPKDQVTDPADDTKVELGNGAIFGLAPGEKVQALDPSRPNGGFDQFVVAICRHIGAGLGLPFELLIMHFTSSYSASRGALLEAWKRFIVGRTWLASGFCQPIYEQWLEEAVARGYIDAPGFFSDPLIRAAWCGAEWHGPTQGQLNPLDEVNAAANRVREGFSTRTRETRELTGGDFWDNHRLRAREEAARRADGLVAEPEKPSSTAEQRDIPQEAA